MSAGYLRLLASGQEAIRIAAPILLTAKEKVIPTANYGDVLLTPGAVWGGDRLLIEPTYCNAYYIIRDRLFECGVLQFIHDEWYNAIGRGAKGAKPMVCLTQTMIEFLQGVFVPWWSVLGFHMAATSLFVYTNWELIKEVFSKAETLKTQLDEFAACYPKTTKILKEQFNTFLAFSLPAGRRIEDLAYFVGTVIQAQRASITVFRTILNVTLANLAQILRLPIFALRWAVARAKEITNLLSPANIEFLRQRYAEMGVTISLSDAIEVVQELCSYNDTPDKLRKLAKSIEEILPLIDRLISRYQIQCAL